MKIGNAKYYILLIILCLPTAFMAQAVSASLILGKRDPLPSYFEFSKKDKGLVTLGNMSRKSSRYMGLFKYDRNFELSWSKQIYENNGRKNIDFMTVIGDKILVFISEYYPKSRIIKTYYYQYDLEGTEVKSRKVISQLSNEKEHRVDLKYVRSINKKTLLCYKNLDYEGKNEKLTFTLLSRISDEVISGEIEIPYPDEKFKVREIHVSNDGEIYVLGKYFKVNRIKSPNDFAYVIFRYNPYDQSISKVEFNLRDKFIADLTFKIDSKKNIYASGFYSNKSSPGIIGILYQKISPENEILVNSIQKFNNDFLSEFLSEKQIRNGQELKYFYLDDIILRSDGGVLLIAEKYYASYNSYMDIYGYWVDQKIHHYDEIIITSVSNQGELEWSSVISKRQSSESNENLSYINMIDGHQIYLIYEYQPRKSPKAVYYNTVDMHGSVSDRDHLLSLSEGNVTFFPRSSEQISNREALLVYFRNREKTFSIVKMDFSVE